MFSQASNPTPTPATGGFSFGNTSTASKPAFSFGNAGSSLTPATPATPAITTNTTATSGGFSFGANPTGSTKIPSATTGGFQFGSGGAVAGSTTTGTTGAGGAGGTGFTFGSKPAGTTSLLGASSAPSLFGTKPAGSMGVSTSSSLFGGNQQTQQMQQKQPLQQQLQSQQVQLQPIAVNSQPSFAWSKPSNTLTTNTTQSSLTTFNSQQQPQNATISSAITTTNSNPQDYTPTINDKLEKIKSSWDSTNPQCKMVTHLYNKVDPSFNNFSRPANETPEEWEEAMRNRPKEYNTIPVKCSGFNELYERNQIQDNHVKQTRFLLNEINDKLTKLNEKHDLHSNTLLMKCKMKQKDLNIKLLRIAINLSILKYKGYPLTNDEELLIERFKTLLGKLDDPVGLNRVNELWARLSSLKEKYSDLPTPIQLSTQTGTEESVDESSDVMKKLAKVLAKQQQGIQLLCELMEEDEEKLNRLVQ